MALRYRIQKIDFRFKFDARTSRGPMASKTSWFVVLWDDRAPEVQGIGECGPLPGLSPELAYDPEALCREALDSFCAIGAPDLLEIFEMGVGKLVRQGFSSIVFALETALLDLHRGGRRILFENGFLSGQPLPINGLVWMGDEVFMTKQVDEKIRHGYRCIKLKIGGIDFDRECAILTHIRSKFDKNKVTLRLDANGAFAEAEALVKLERLALYDIHSIEQPLKAGSARLAELCRVSPIPIALDEELIGQTHRKRELLESIRPPYIILKPTLHGGMKHCEQWIAIARELGTDWWITSALESNIGLNAVCQFTANYPVTIPQGLGTGGLYENNFSSPLQLRGDTIYLDNALTWDTKPLSHS